MILIAYAAMGIFFFGMLWRVIRWSLSPVPFRIPTTCGQQKSLPWIPHNWIESPSTTAGVVARMAIEILFFRSLFRNSKSQLGEGPRLHYFASKIPWLGALTFHWSLAIILLRHLRLFVEPAPKFVLAMDRVDGFFEIGAPVLYLTDVAVVAAMLFLLARRFTNPAVRYISLFTDYFALALLLGIATTGICMRYFDKVDVIAAKQFAIGLATFAPVYPANLNAIFWTHLCLVSALAAYFPFSKLVHMGGIFLSPTRNLANNSRRKRHVNPWNYPVAVHTYEEWEMEFHDKMAAAGMPLEKP